MKLSIPSDFATATVAREGEAGRAWLRALPDLVADLCDRWTLAPDGRTMHGYLGLVIPVRRRDEPCVLKVSWPDESTAAEPHALALWGGRGAARLLASDPMRTAMLLERLNSRLPLRDVELTEAIPIAGHLLRRLAIPVPSGFRLLTDEAQRLAHNLPELWERYGRTMPRRWLDAACEVATQLGPTSGNLLVNYDLHYENILAATREPWLAVDPKVIVGDLEFAIAQLLWTRLEDINANGGLDRFFPLLVDAAALDPARARAWTLVRCVDYWLWGVSVGLTTDPARCEAILTWLT